MSDFFTANQNELRSFMEMSQAVGARADYVQGGGGNTSVKLAGGLMAIKASGYRLADIRVEAAYAVLDGNAVRSFYESHEAGEFQDVEKAGADFAKSQVRQVECLPALRPSVEAGFHSLLDRYVVHSHSAYANLAACAAGGREIVEKALAGADYSWGFVPYTDPGALLTFTIRDELKRVQAATGKRPAAVFLQNHGLIAHAGDAAEALRVHGDVNARLAAYFGVDEKDYPEIKLVPRGGGLFASGTQYVRERLMSGKYGRAFFLDSPLYPDQMVFFTGTLDVGEGAPQSGCCTVNPKTGEILYNMNEQKAAAIEETVAAVLFIAEHTQRKGYQLCSLGDAARDFIGNWESEKYRKSLQGK